jgi:tetratricopeptide (TPR) repeat protein
MGFRQFFKDLLLAEEAAANPETETSARAARAAEAAKDTGLTPAACEALDAELATAFRAGGFEYAFGLAADALRRGNYPAALYLYRQTAERFPEVRHDCEGQMGLTLYCMGEYYKAIDSYIAARVHGASPEWMDETIWEACETLARQAQNPIQMKEPLMLYLRLCPKGNYRTQAEQMMVG